MKAQTLVAFSPARSAELWGMPALTRRRDRAPERPQKITFGEMRSSGVRGILIYCADYHCSHSIAISADQWPITSGSPIWKHGSFAKPAEKEGLMSGRTFIGTRSRSRRWAIVSALVAPHPEDPSSRWRQPTAAHVPAPARMTTNATKSAASIVDRVQLFGIVGQLH